MEAVFFRLLNLSLMASLMVVVVLVLRLLFRRAPKWVFCALWGLVALRLLMPFSIESPTSLMPTAEPVPYSAVHAAPAAPSTPVLPNVTPAPADTPVTVTPTAPAAPVVNDSAPAVDHAAPVVDPAAEAASLSVMDVLAWVWLVGVVAMLGYGLGSYLLLRSRLRTAVREEGRLWLSDRIESPFVLGLFRPRIYLPFRVKGEARAHVLAHEQAHILRGDHWWKLLGFLLLAVYWFNPLLWVAYVLLCRDIESACDEKVIQNMDNDSRKVYSYALLSLSTHSRRVAVFPVSFGEEGVKGRVKRVMSYKRPAFWIILLAIVAVVATAVCLLTVPATSEPDATEPTIADTEPLPSGLLPFTDKATRWIGTVTPEERPDLQFTLTEFSITITKAPFPDARDLIYGLPIRSAWFADLNGDGVRELCADVYYGFGMVDSHVLVYDPVSDSLASIWNRGICDYSLRADEAGRLLVDKFAYTTNNAKEPLVTYTLTADENAVSLIAENGAHEFYSFEAHGDAADNPNVLPLVQTGHSASYQTESGIRHSYEIPMVNLPGEQIDQLNSDLYLNHYFDRMGSNGYPTTSDTSYQWMLNGSMLTLILREDFGYDNSQQYTVYRIDADAKTVLTDEDILQAIGLSQQDFTALAKEALGNTFACRLSDYIAQVGTADVFLRELFRKTVSEENISAATVYLGEDGQPYLCAAIYQPAGADFVQELIPLVDYASSEYYTALAKQN